MTWKAERSNSEQAIIIPVHVQSDTLDINEMNNSYWERFSLSLSLLMSRTIGYIIVTILTKYFYALSRKDPWSVWWTLQFNMYIIYPADIFFYIYW